MLVEHGLQPATTTADCSRLRWASAGCGPSDMHTVRLTEPSGPCLPGDGCPFLCEDAGLAYARNLCRSLPVNISWWEGRNVFNASLFGENVMAPKYEFEIYIERVDKIG
jgi:hypothetical protein